MEKFHVGRFRSTLVKLSEMVGKTMFKSIKAKLWYSIYKSRLHCLVTFHTRFRRWKHFLKGGSIRVLEVGGGGGPWTFELLEKGNYVVEVDVSEDSLKRLKNKLIRFNWDSDMIKLIHSDMKEYCDDGLYDEIVLFEVLEHIIDDKAVMEKLCRMLNPGGLLLVSAPSHDYELFYGERTSEVEDGAHVRKGYSFEDFEALMPNRCEIICRDSCNDYLIQRMEGLRRRLFDLFPNRWFNLMMVLMQRPFAYMDGLFFKNRSNLTNFVIIEKKLE